MHLLGVTQDQRAFVDATWGQLVYIALYGHVQATEFNLSCNKVKPGTFKM